MAHYQFESEWAITAPAVKVFDLLSRADNFIDWWPSVTDSTLIETGDGQGVGRVVAYRLRSPLLYRLDFNARVTSVEAPTRIAFTVRGDLMGTCTYLIGKSGESGSHVRIQWSVSTTKKWMNALHPVVRPVFMWAHGRLMRQGARALADRLHAYVVSSDTYVVDTQSVTV